MHAMRVIIVTVTLFSYICATNYKAGYGGGGVRARGRTHGRDASGGYEGGQNYPRKPYRIDYSVDDGEGNMHYRHEKSDEFGAVSGTYGYRNALGLYRMIEYVADARGFRANVITNEPGAANVNTIPEKPDPRSVMSDVPPSVQEVLNGTKYAVCQTGKDFDVKACIQAMGSG